MNLKLVSLISLIILTSCVSKHEPLPIHDEGKKVQSAEQLPYWIHYDFIESQVDFNFISEVTTQFHTPTFAYRKVRRQLYTFFESEIDFILSPLKGQLSKNKLNDLKKRFIEYLAQETLLEIRKTKQIFWIHEEIKQKNKMIDNYRYFVLISLDKKQLRLNERKFISNEMIKSYYTYQSLVKKQLKYAYENIKQLDKIDALKHPILIESVNEISI